MGSLAFTAKQIPRYLTSPVGRPLNVGLTPTGLSLGSSKIINPGHGRQRNALHCLNMPIYGEKNIIRKVKP
jgi:hypothetical protein